MIQNNTMQSKVFVILANRRTGSNYLMKVLDSFSEIEFFGEVFHWDTVWMPYQRKKEFVEWLKKMKNIDINIGEKSFEDQALVKLNHLKPNYFLDFLVSNTKKKYTGFKIFREHLSWENLEKNLLLNKKITKIILNRNLLDIYISDKILDQTKHSQSYDTSHIKIKINFAEFNKWYLETQKYYNRIESCLKNDSQQLINLSYEDIHSYTSNDQKVAFISSWLNKQGFEIESVPKINNYTTKQDQRKNYLEKIENVQEINNYLYKNNLQHLIMT
jgi:hypothetical protein